jgi:hypothetical protein
MTFLKAMARDLYSRYGDELSGLTVVFPSKRVQLFFSEELAAIIDKPLWAPKYASVEEIFASFSDLEKADDFAMLALLFNVFGRHTNSIETFDKFYFWGETLLEDFNDIDRYLVDVRMLFRNLKAQKNLEGDFSFLSEEQIDYIRRFWESFDPVRHSPLQDKFIEIWDVLPTVYGEFRALLRSRGLAYAGMIQRDTAEKIAARTLPETDERYVFAGFNALSECEASLFSHLRRRERADFYWDCDPYYLDDRNHEAGMFLRANIERFPPPPTFDPQPEFSMHKDIHLVAVPSDVLQAKILPELFRDMSAPFDRTTVVALADESILIPVLHSIPDECADINITLGYALRRTPVYALVELLARLQWSRAEKTRGFHRKDAIAVLRHRYVAAAAGDAAKAALVRVVRGNRAYVGTTIFADNPFLSRVFSPASGCRETTEWLTDVLSQIAVASADEQVMEYVFHVVKALNRLNRAIEDSSLDPGRQVFLALIRDVLGNLKIPFAGEPVKGLQIMNLRETRALDFDNVIILSANEGRLPPSSSSLSYIPYNLRKAYGLPGPEHPEAGAAYNFYRLLQRAKKVRLVYSTKTDESRTGEMSRYLRQLKFESGFDIREYPVTFSVNFGARESIAMEKGEAAKAVLSKYLSGEKALSPSALSSYIACPLHFYFEKIADLRQPEVLSEEVPPNILGNIIHRVMEILYTPMKGRTASAEALKALRDDDAGIDALVDRIFASEFYGTDTLPDDFDENGKLLITRDVMGKYIRGILDYDAAHAGFVPLGFEERTGMIMKAGELSVHLTGIIDRIDRAENSVRIVDYKTGAGRGAGRRMSFDGVDSLFDPNPDRRNKEAFQTFMYALIYGDEKRPAEPLTPALYFVRDCRSPDFNYMLADTSKEERAERRVANFDEYKAEFGERLAQCLQELFDPQIPFRQTEYTDTCLTCPYISVCNISPQRNIDGCRINNL